MGKFAVLILSRGRGSTILKGVGNCKGVAARDVPSNTCYSREIIRDYTSAAVLQHPTSRWVRRDSDTPRGGCGQRIGKRRMVLMFSDRFEMGLPCLVFFHQPPRRSGVS
jgi:hypothetical protein